MTAVSSGLRPFPVRFRRRLALLCTAAVALATAIFGLGSFVFIRNDKLDRFHTSVVREVQLHVAMARNNVDAAAMALVEHLVAESRGAVILVGETYRVASAGAVAVDDIPPELLGPESTEVVTAVTTADGTPYLVAGAEVPERDEDLFFFFDRTDVTQEVGRVGRTLLVAWLAVVAVAAAACGRLARRALWPVRRAAEAANDLASGLLQVRLPVEGDDEFAAWAASFNRMVDELERRIARERRFTADVAHELRTPLGSLLTAATLLEANREALPDGVRRPADLLVQELRRLRRLVEDLLEISRLEAGPESIARTDVELRERIAELLASRGWTQQVSVSGPSLHVATDPRRVDRIVGNLVENALRHGKEPVVVRLSQRSGEVVIEVEDHGDGIPPDELPALFEPFFKRDASRRGPGSGLGLAIAAQHARVLGGRLLAEPRPGVGMCFALVLPDVSAPEGGPEEDEW